MKYTSEVIINLPREKVTDLMDNWDNFPEWQEGFKKAELISGEPGEVGAKSRLIYEERGKDVELIETIIKSNFPEEFTATYEAKGVNNLSIHKFFDVDKGKTKWVQENEFKFSGFMRILSVILRKSITKQTLKDMNQFKKFAESHN